MTLRRKGRVVLVGAGPGDPELLTIKALRLLEQADVVVYDSLVSKEVLRLVPSNCQMCFVGKRKNRHKVNQDQICQLLVNYACENELVVRLKGGDPMIFGRAAEEMVALDDAEIPWSVVPGITAASGAAASCAITLTRRKELQSVTYVTAHNVRGQLDIDWQLLMQPKQTFVIYMGLSLLPDIVTGLLARGCQGTTPFTIVSRATQSSEVMVSGSLTDIVEKARDSEVKSPAILIMGAKPFRTPLNRDLLAEEPSSMGFSQFS